jgi:outer membrane murein-binding lipoprotein Lpp
MFRTVRIIIAHRNGIAGPKSEKPDDMADDDTQRILAAIDRLETKQDAMRADFDRLETRQDKMRAEITERIDRVQHSVDLTRDEIVVNFGNTDRAERTARAAIDHTRITTEILRTMQRQIARLQTDVEQLKGPP